jgi:hypothetical protein
MKLLIDKQAFINWYFDHDICKEFFYTHNILGELKEKGTFTISLQDILNDVGYLPEDIVVEGQDVELDDNGEVAMFDYDEIVFA